jgi:diguanylate cyclase (GGDEF)-like protein
MSRLIDMSDWNDQHPSATGAREIGLSYVLIADANVQRTAACLKLMKPFNVGALVARDGEEAIRVLERFGPPILLITDLSLSRKDGFAVIEALRTVDPTRAEIIAWSSFRELREFAAHRFAGLNVRVFGRPVAPGVVGSAIERALRSRAAANRSSPSSPDPGSEDVYQTMTELSERARQLCGTAGVAVYLRASGDMKFRASVIWTSDEPIPHSPYHIPRVFDWILETGEALVLPDLVTQPLSDMPMSTLQDVVRGLVAVPIVSNDRQVVGTICVFDVKPLTFGLAEVDALKALGRGVSAGSTTASAEPETADQPPGAPAPAVSHQDDAAASLSLDAPSIEALDHGVSVAPAATPVVPEAGDQLLRGPEPAGSLPDDAAESPSLDSHTALLDRRGGYFAIARELARARREQRQLSVVLFGVGTLSRTDGGTVTGSTQDLLDTVRETLTEGIRGSDLAIRWSGEELLLVLPGLSATEARPVAERVRAAMQAGARHRVAVSGGVAELLADETFESVVARAGEMVRFAREHGHNRVA